jgi:hypothetical protein
MAAVVAEETDTHIGKRFTLQVTSFDPRTDAPKTEVHLSGADPFYEELQEERDTAKHATKKDGRRRVVSVHQQLWQSEFTRG